MGLEKGTNPKESVCGFCLDQQMKVMLVCEGNERPSWLIRCEDNIRLPSQPEGRDA